MYQYLYEYDFSDNYLRVRGKEIEKNEDETHLYDLSSRDIPEGWTKRQGKDWLFHANSQSLESLFLFRKGCLDHQYRGRGYAFDFSQSFCNYLQDKIEEEKQEQGVLSILKDIVGVGLDTPEKVQEALSSIKGKNLDVAEAKDFPHQILTKMYSCKFDASAILLEQGLGKTKVGIDTYKYKKYAGKVDKCLVIAPIAVLGEQGWEKEIKSYGLNGSSIDVINLCELKKEQKIDILNGVYGEYDFYLINYEAINAIKTELLAWCNEKTMVILDESSKIKTWSAKRTRLCIEIGKRVIHKNILTGTPITQGAKDIFPQFMFLDNGDSFGSSYDKFIDRYFVKSGYKIFPRHGALEKIKTIIHKKGIRMTKKECISLPEKLYQLRQVEMDEVQTDYYNKILRNEIIRLEGLEHVKANNILTTILRLQQITSGFLSPQIPEEMKVLMGIDPEIEPKSIWDDISKNPKLQELEDVLGQIDLKEDQVIIWSRFRFDIRTIKKFLMSKGIDCATYYGEQLMQENELHEKRFINGTARVMISNPASGGMGKNWQNANYMIYYCNDYSLQNRLQSEDRFYRMGQNKTCTVIDITARKSIDGMVHQVLRDKKSIADILTNDAKRVLNNLFLSF